MRPQEDSAGIMENHWPGRRKEPNVRPRATDQHVLGTRARWVGSAARSRKGVAERGGGHHFNCPDGPADRGHLAESNFRRQTIVSGRGLVLPRPCHGARGLSRDESLGPQSPHPEAGERPSLGISHVQPTAPGVGTAANPRCQPSCN